MFHAGAGANSLQLVNLSSADKYNKFVEAVILNSSDVELENEVYSAADVMKLIVSSAKVESLAVITATFKRLTCLVVSFNKISCIQALSELTSLEYLDVRRSSLSPYQV